MDSQFFPGGLLNTAVPGRTDRLPIAVPSNSYVVPADVVSGLGQGNTASGAVLLSQMFGTPAEARASGGGVEAAQPVDIIAAGGEFVIPPEVVARIGGGDMTKGHDLLDKFVLKVRKQVAERMLRLPGPKR